FRGRLCVRTARADRDEALFGLEHVAVARDQERGVLVGDGEHGFETAEAAIRAPILRELDRRAREIVAVLGKLVLEELEQREGIGRGAGEARKHVAGPEPAYLACVRFDDRVAERDL